MEINASDPREWVSARGLMNNERVMGSMTLKWVAA